MLISCKECGHQVSDKADKCPSCGIKMPKRYSFIESMGFILFGGFAVIYFATNDNETKYHKEPVVTQAVTTEPEPKEPVKLSCATDWKLCKTTSDLLNENKEMAIQIQVACKMESEKKHTQSIDWGGFLSPNFSSYIPEDFSGDKKEVTVIDDLAMYENIYGAKVKTKTLCVYNLNTMKAVTIITTQM